MTGSIQGNDVVFSIFDGTNYVPYVCAKSVRIDTNTETVEKRTVGDGVWKKTDYKALSYSITLSSVLKFDTSKMGFDILTLQLNFAAADYELTFDDKNGNIKSIRGRFIVAQSSLDATSGNVVMADFTLQGTGAFILFDGLVPCTIIATNIVESQEAPGSPAQFSTTTTGGTPVRWDYIIDGGDRLPSDVNPFFVSGLSLGLHSIEIIPVCSNGFDGTSFVKTFTIV